MQLLHATRIHVPELGHKQVGARNHARSQRWGGQVREQASASRNYYCSSEVQAHVGSLFIVPPVEKSQWPAWVSGATLLHGDCSLPRNMFHTLALVPHCTQTWFPDTASTTVLFPMLLVHLSTSSVFCSLLWFLWFQLQWASIRSVRCHLWQRADPGPAERQLLPQAYWHERLLSALLRAAGPNALLWILLSRRLLQPEEVPALWLSGSLWGGLPLLWNSQHRMDWEGKLL